MQHGMIVPVAIPVFLNHPGWIIPYIKDQFSVACLHAPVHWKISELLPAGILLTGTIILILNFSKNAKRQFLILGLTSLFFIISAILTYPQKAELYSQNALIGFCQRMGGKEILTNLFT